MHSEWFLNKLDVKVVQKPSDTSGLPKHKHNGFGKAHNAACMHMSIKSLTASSVAPHFPPEHRDLAQQRTILRLAHTWLYMLRQVYFAQTKASPFPPAAQVSYNLEVPETPKASCTILIWCLLHEAVT